MKKPVLTDHILVSCHTLPQPPHLQGRWTTAGRLLHRPMSRFAMSSKAGSLRLAIIHTVRLFTCRDCRREDAPLVVVVVISLQAHTFVSCDSHHSDFSESCHNHVKDTHTLSVHPAAPWPPLALGVPPLQLPSPSHSQLLPEFCLRYPPPLHRHHHYHSHSQPHPL